MLIYLAGAGSVVLLSMGFLLRAARVARFFPTWMQGWGRGLILIWAFVSILTLLSVWLASRIPVSAERRGFLFQSLRYIQIEELAPGNCIVAVGVRFSGLRGELKTFGVGVTLIRPGFIATEFITAANAASADSPPSNSS